MISNHPRSFQRIPIDVADKLQPVLTTFTVFGGLFPFSRFSTVSTVSAVLGFFREEASQMTIHINPTRNRGWLESSDISLLWIAGWVESAKTQLKIALHQGGARRIAPACVERPTRRAGGNASLAKVGKALKMRVYAKLPIGPLNSPFKHSPLNCTLTPALSQRAREITR
jgi:hypothetical protein